VPHRPGQRNLIQTSSTPLPATDLDDLPWLPVALEQHAQRAPALNSYQCHWRKAFPGEELEHKYTLPAGTAIWDLAVDTLQGVHDGALPGFRLMYRDEFQTWDYLNHLFDIQKPEGEQGYVSFIPNALGEGWRMKRK
jgi:hypothetical protein